MNLTENQVISINVPRRTETYEPVPNKFLIDLIREISGDYGYIVSESKYKVARGGEIVVGTFTFHSYDDDMGMQIAFSNSYDKSRKVTLASGAEVFVCTNGMINAEEIFTRKHTGTVKDDLMDMIEIHIQKMQSNYNNLVDFKDIVKRIDLSINEMFKIIGDMYFSTDMLSIRQISALKEQFYDKNFGILGDRTTLWNIYNWITETYKKEHPSTYIQKHVKLHNHFNKLLNEYI